MILNLTQHKATPEQLTAGVFEPSDELKARIQRLLTFDTLPCAGVIRGAAEELAIAAAVAMEAKTGQTAGRVMIGGAPFLMAPLEAALREAGMTPVYAFSVRHSSEFTQPDGSVLKTTTFTHLGFV